MADINLLPWRAQKRAHQVKQSAIYLLIGFFIAVSIVLYSDHVVLKRVEHQLRRNQQLEHEIAQCKHNAIEANHLESERAALIQKMGVIQQLHIARTIPVRFLYELMSIIPEGVSVNQVEKRADQIILIGFAKSNQPISQLMRNIAANPLIHEPDLPEIKTTNLATQSGEHEFKLMFSYKGSGNDRE